MPDKSSSLERNIIENPSEGKLQPVKAKSSKSTISPLPLEPLFTRKIPAWKRTIDIAGSIMGLFLLSPLILSIAIVIKLTSKGPIFFAQERTGHNLCRFKMYKFRTMVDGADKQLEKIRYLNEMSGPLIKMEKDPRLTSIGGLLRKTSLDELPQLFNVLKGDMTIIGPRALSPLPSQYKYWQRRRFTIKPGIACLWQAERRSDRDFEEWMRSDLRYLDSASPWIDICILMKTFWRLIRCQGAR